MISFEKKFLFIDIVKTAGTAIGGVLEQYGGTGKHHSVSRPLPDLPQNRSLESLITPRVLDEYFCFTFVRNPYDRIVSLFSYCQHAPLQIRFSREGWGALSRPSHGTKPDRAWDRKTYWPTDFPLFLDWLIEHDMYYCDFTGEKYITMKEWIIDQQGVPRVDFVGFYERLQKDIGFVLNKIGGRPYIVPIVNESSNIYKLDAAKIIQSSKNIQSSIQAYYKDDFDFFGYSTHFEESVANKTLQRMR